MTNIPDVYWEGWASGSVFFAEEGAGSVSSACLDLLVKATMLGIDLRMCVLFKVYVIKDTKVCYKPDHLCTVGR